MSDFKTTDFVQVEHWDRLSGGEPYSFWRNALYVNRDLDGKHIVIYADGTKEVLHDGKKIRCARV